MNPNLFKSTEFYKRRYQNFSTVLIIPILGLFVFLVSFVMIAKIEITVKSVGEITPTTVISVIQSTSDNTVLTNNLKDNLLVKKGELLVEYSSALDETQKTNLENQISVYQNQLKGLEVLKESLNQGTNLFTDDSFGYSSRMNQYLQKVETLRLSVEKGNEEVALQQEAVSKSQQEISEEIQKLQGQVADYQELKTAISQKSKNLPDGNPYQNELNTFWIQYEQAQWDESIVNQYLTQIESQITTLQSSVASLEIQLAGLASTSTYDTSLASQIETLKQQELETAEQTKTEVQLQLQEVQTQLDQSTIQLGDNTLLAPANGVIHLNSEVDGQTMWAKGTEIAQLYPEISNSKTVNITYYVNTNEVSKIRTGQTVRMTIKNSSKENLLIAGKVTSIASTATSAENENLFKIVAEVQLDKTLSQQLKYGMEGKVVCITGKKTYFELLKEKFLSFKD